MDDKTTGLHHVTSRGVADADGPEGRAPVERDRNASTPRARRRTPNGRGRCASGAVIRAFRRAGPARAVRRHRDVADAVAAVDPLRDDAGVRRVRAERYVAVIYVFARYRYISSRS